MKKSNENEYAPISEVPLKQYKVVSAYLECDNWRSNCEPLLVSVAKNIAKITVVMSHLRNENKHCSSYFYSYDNIIGNGTWNAEHYNENDLVVIPLDF